jgi:hypothetical protein
MVRPGYMLPVQSAKKVPADLMHVEARQLVIWNASSPHYKRALGTPKESAYGECRYERPADRAVGAECA